MKAILFIVGTVSLFTAPAVAGNGKKSISKKGTLVAQIEKAPLAELALEAPVGLTAASIELPGSPEMLAMPVLPADMSSPLVPFPELEGKRIGAPAKPIKSAAKTKAPQMKMGKDYVLGGRESAKPTQEVERIILRSLSQSQVATVVQAHLGDIQSCWNTVPAKLRADACTADLKLSISETGAVTDIELGGNVPAAAHKCMTSAISHWSFPVAETTSDVEYGIALHSL